MSLTALDNVQQQMRPEISVVVASVNGPVYLDECLAALENQTLKDHAEVIVAGCCGDGVVELVRRRRVNAKILSFAERKTIPELRAIGIKNSQGAIIAITEDHCLAEPHWYERILRAHETHFGAIGGAIENHNSITRVIDWAVFFCEYSRYMNPIPAGEVSDIPGNNVTYRREFLEYVGDMLNGGQFWESFLNARLRAKGIKLFLDPSIVVFHKKRFGLGYFINQRYHYSRSYTGMRTAGCSVSKRVLYAGFCPLLPILLVSRITSCVVRKKAHLGMFVRAFPLIVFFTVIWAWGEFVGYVFGPGESLLKVD